MKPNQIFFVILLFILSPLHPAWAQAAYMENFTIATRFEVTSLDPHATTLIGSHTVSSHIFDPLFKLDSRGRIEPILVEKTEIESPTKWVFTLKKGIRFHDGTELTSDDVLATFQYIAKNPEQEKLYKGIKIEVLDRNRFRITTPQAIANLPIKLVSSYIIKKSTAQAGSKAFENNPVIGTGPYRLLSHKSFKRLDLEAFDNYHLDLPYLRRVTILTNLTYEQSLRGFIKGEIDFIDRLSIEEANELKQLRLANFISPPGTLLYMLSPDHHNDQSPDIRDHRGEALKQNPLKNYQVRKAISLAINRPALISEFYKNRAKPTAQLQTEGRAGFSLRLKPDQQDIIQAKKLLADSGYPQGFQITLYEKDGRRPQIEAIAKMLQQIGIQATTTTLPSDIFFSKLPEHSFSLAGSIYSQDGDLNSMLYDIVYTGGAANDGRYSNPEIDKLIDEANAEFNETRRLRELRYINEKAMQDLPVIPLFFIGDVWAINSKMFFVPAGAQYTEAYYVKPAHSNDFNSN